MSSVPNGREGTDTGGDHEPETGEHSDRPTALRLGLPG
ncbi:hypothetical protein J3R03_005622 [Actinoplanes couchii]|nr:hypothetical protein [Actinoplanes couchii]